MSKTKQPLLSLGASGSIADLLTYQRISHQDISRSKPRLPYFMTLPTRYQRWLYQDYAYYWRQQTPATRQLYTTAGSPHHLTGFQYWMKYHLTNLPDLAGYWKLDTHTGPTTPDSSRNANTGTIIGAFNVTGLIDECLSFDGINDEVDCGNDPSLQLVDDFTLMAFTRAGVINAVIDIAGKLRRFPNRQGISIWRTAANEYAFTLYAAGFSGNVLSDILYPDLIWHHIAGRRQAGVSELFVDGQKQLGSSAFAPLDSGQNFFIARFYSDFAPYSANLTDQVLFLNRPLDDTEIARHAARRWPES